MGWLKKRKEAKKAKKEAKRQRKEEKRAKKHERKLERKKQKQAVKMARQERKRQAALARAEAKKGKKGFAEAFGDVAGDVVNAFSGNSDDGGGFMGSLPSGLQDFASSYSGGNAVESNDDFGDMNQKSIITDGDAMPELEKGSESEGDFTKGYYDENKKWVEFNAIQKLLVSFGLIKKQA